jgi:site-specific DNA recombinase
MTADAPTRCALYLRQSLDATGEQLAVARQRASCLDITARKGWTVVAEFVDNSISASDKRKARPGYDALVDAYGNGEFDALICYDLDRLTRQPRQLEDWIDAATDRGLLLVTANGEADLSTDGGRMYARIKASVARGEIERKSARQTLAAAQRADRGRPPLGTRLTGYTTAGDVVEGEAVVIREVFRRFAAGDSLRSLAAWLTDSKVPTRRDGDRWSPSTVGTMLRNPRYAGRAIYRGAETGKTGGWEPLVDDATFVLVTTRLSDPRRRTNPRGTDRRHLGGGLYSCAVCRHKLVTWSGERYRCPNGCLTRTRPPIDDVVLRVLRARLASPDLTGLIAPQESTEVKALTNARSALRARLAQIENDYDAGLIDGRRFAEASDKVSRDLKAGDAKLARLTDNSSAAATLLDPDPVDAFDRSPLMIQRAVIDALCTVAVAPAPRGRKAFDLETVRIAWR